MFFEKHIYFVLSLDLIKAIPTKMNTITTIQNTVLDNPKIPKTESSTELNARVYPK